MSLSSQNRFASLLGNDEEEEQSNVPVKTVDKSNPRTFKRNAEPEAPVRAAGTGGNRRGGPGGSEGAFQDRGAGSDRNRAKATDEAPRGGPRGGAGARVRGSRGSRRDRPGEDRNHARHGGHGGADKQVAAAWGGNEGDDELKDAKAGEAIAESEQKEALIEDAAGEEPAEPEDKSISYADYLAQQSEKKAALDSGLKVREANEGAKLDKKWANAKPLDHQDDEGVYFAGTAGKKQRERERKVKQTIDFDPRFLEPERPRGGHSGAPRGTRGGRGGSERGRGGPERGRGGSERGRGGSERGRGGPERGRGGPERGARSVPFRGARGGARENAAPINTSDESAFPSLGGK